MSKNHVLIPPATSVKTEHLFFADFGRHAFAVLEAEVETETPQKIILAVGEIAQDARIDQAPGNSCVYQEQEISLTPGKHDLRMEMIHNGYNSGTIPLTPNAVPFRYAEIRGDVKIHNVYQHAYFGHFDDDASDFKSSSPTLDKIWEFCKYTMKATSTFGIFVDGNRERQAYEGDVYINQLGYFVCTSHPEIARQTIDQLFAHPTWPTEWRLLMIPIVHDYVLYTGDMASLERWYDRLKENLLLDGMDENGLLSAKHLEKLPGSLGFNDVKVSVRDIVDWPLLERDGYEMGEVNLVPNCYFYMALNHMAEIARLLNKNEDITELRKNAARTKDAIRKTMLKNGLFTDNPDSDHTALHSCIFPVLWDIASDKEKAAHLALLRQKGMACSVFAAQFLLECCYLNNLADHGFELMTSDGKRSWLNMINCGATISMEAWDDSFKPNQDWSHPWGAAPGNIIVRFVAGIRPLEPGFKKFLVAPQPAGLQHFKLKTPTPHGAILLEMTSPGIYNLTVPQNTCAVFNGREYPAGEHQL